MSFIRIGRILNRPIVTIILLILTMFMILNNFRMYKNEKMRQYATRPIRVNARAFPESDSKPQLAENSLIKVSMLNTDEPQVKRSVSDDMFVNLASDEHLLSLLTKQANKMGQVLITIIGGDSYSLFAWDWYERMLEISSDPNNCHCILIAMDEIAVIVAIQRSIPVYYSTFSFDQQMQWINTIEARQHSLYRVGHAKFQTTAKIIQLGYSVMLSEMDVFWKKSPFDHLKQPLETYDLQISHHYGSHPRVNIGLFYTRPTNASITFLTHVAEFWVRYGKGGYLSDQRVLDALLNNYDRLDKTYLNAMNTLPPITFNWTTHDFGNEFSHMMTDGSAFILFNQAARYGTRSKKFHGEGVKFFTVNVSHSNMSVSHRNLLIRSLLILQHTKLQNRTLIFPAFSPNLTILPITYQLDIKKFFLYWSEERIRLPEFLELQKSSSIPITSVPYSPQEKYDDIKGILNFTIESIPLDLPAPSPQFEVHVRDSLLWCSPPMVGGAWCSHHPRDFGATMELLFSCRGDPYPPCANKTERNEQFLIRPYEKQ